MSAAGLGGLAFCFYFLRRHGAWAAGEVTAAPPAATQRGGLSPRRSPASSSMRCAELSPHGGRLREPLARSCAPSAYDALYRSPTNAAARALLSVTARGFSFPGGGVSVVAFAPSASDPVPSVVSARGFELAALASARARSVSSRRRRPIRPSRRRRGRRRLSTPRAGRLQIRARAVYIVVRRGPIHVRVCSTATASRGWGIRSKRNRPRPRRG